MTSLGDHQKIKQIISRVLCLVTPVGVLRGMAIELTSRLTAGYLAAYPGMIARRITSSSPIWHCSMQRLPVSPVRFPQRLVSVALILVAVLRRRPALPGCIILWSSDFPLRRQRRRSSHP